VIASAQRWALPIAATALIALAFDLAHVPSPVLLGAVLGGIVAALLVSNAPDLPRRTSFVAQGILGVASGSYVRSSTLASVGEHWFPVVLVCVATLALSIMFGLAFAEVAPVDRATASVGLIAGGAAGIVSISRELGADDRIVLVLQYLRVLLIVTFMPVVAAGVFHLSAHTANGGSAGGGLAGALGFVLICLAIGLPLGHVSRIPAGSLIGPMVVAASLAAVDGSIAHPVPGVLQNLAFAVVGLQVGLRFTPASLRAVGSLLPVATLFIVGLIASCGLLGVLLARMAHVNELDGYLATTPGGLYVVLATAVSGSANAGFVLSVQLLRTFLMLLAAPPLVRLLVRRGTTSSFVGVELAPAASAMGCANSPSSLGGAEIQS
jgi:uncharacterized protein